MRIGDKPLKELSDRELELELQRRRRARGQGPGTFSTTTGHGARRGAGSREGAPGWKLRQWLRNLELEKGAGRDEVELAYVRLSEKYHPDRQDDPGKKRLARQLGDGLREAYQGLLQHFERED